MMGWVDGDRPETRMAKIRAFEFVLVVHLFCEFWHVAPFRRKPWGTDTVLEIALFMALIALALWPRWRRPAFAGLALFQLYIIALMFPSAGNHAFLEFLLPALLACFDLKEEKEQRLLLNLLRWTIVILLFYSGLQKLIHGYYFRGELLAYYVAHNEQFRMAIGFVLDRDELSRLTSLTLDEGAGPYRVTSLPFILLSNAVYIAEIALAAALLNRRTRPVAIYLALLMIAVIEFAAHELYFLGIFVNVLLLFFPGDLNRKLVIPFAAFYALLLVLRLMAYPEMPFG